MTLVACPCLCAFSHAYSYFVFVYVCACTQLVFMWGNLGLASEEKREVPVPLLLPGQVGVVSVAFVPPVMEGTYTSHWRLAHCGCQFGPRVWCSIVVDPSDSCNPLGHLSKRLASLLNCDTQCSCSCLNVQYCAQASGTNSKVRVLPKIPIRYSFLCVNKLP